MSTSSTHVPRRNSTVVASNPEEPPDDARQKISDPLADVVAGCRRGDRQSQRLIYEHCRNRIFRLLVHMVGEQDAADLLQHVFLHVFLKIDRFSGRAQFETWIYRVAINECLQFRRKRARAHREMPADDLPDPSADHTLRTQQQEIVERALSALTSELRAV